MFIIHLADFRTNLRAIRTRFGLSTSEVQIRQWVAL